MRSRYGSTDIRIPNLDAMPQSALVKFHERALAAASKADSTRMRGPRGDWLRLAARYAKYKAAAMKERLAGKIPLATRYEAECDNIYSTIPARMRW